MLFLCNFYIYLFSYLFLKHFLEYVLPMNPKSSDCYCCHSEIRLSTKETSKIFLVIYINQATRARLNFLKFLVISYSRCETEREA